MGWKGIDIMATDSPPPENVADACEKNNVEIIIAR